MANKKQRKNSRRARTENSPRAQVKRQLKSFNWKLLGLLALLTMAALTVQHLCLVYLYSPIAMNAYLVIVFVCLILFMVFNKGFQKTATPAENLPRSWSADEQAAFLDKEAKNKKIARVIMIIMVPLMFVLIFDFILIVLGII